MKTEEKIVLTTTFVFSFAAFEYSKYKILKPDNVETETYKKYLSILLPLSGVVYGVTGFIILKNFLKK